MGDAALDEPTFFLFGSIGAAWPDPDTDAALEANRWKSRRLNGHHRYLSFGGHHLVDREVRQRLDIPVAA